MKVKMRITAVYEYEADSDNYGTEDTQEMAAIDLENAQDDLFGVLQAADEIDLKVVALV